MKQSNIWDRHDATYRFQIVNRTGDRHMKIYGSISTGTLLTEDLLQAFMDALEELNPSAYQAFKYDSYADILNYSTTEEADLEAQEEFLNGDLWDALNDCAPEGHYFGAHPGDGADFGFWPEETEEEP